MIKKALLKFGKGNAKLDKSTVVFSIPAGHTCPGAKICKSICHPETGEITDLYPEDSGFRCYAAGEERRRTTVRKARWHNYKLLTDLGNDSDKMAELLFYSLRAQLPFERVRVHASGDFFSAAYFKAWMKVAQAWDDVTFYAYTKSLDLWTTHLNLVPSNFILTASFGGTHDALIQKHGLKSVTVYKHPEDAGDLPIDHDDTLALKPGVSFALLLHGSQKKGTPAQASLQRMRKEGVKFSYSAH